MKYLLEYIEKYGSSYFIEEPINEIDILIFSQLIYNHFKGIVERNQPISLQEAAAKFYEEYTKTDVEALLDVAKRAAVLLSACANTKRFGEVQLAHFIDNINDELDKQICAVNFVLPEGTRVVAFRGTDATVTGFKESAMLAYMFPVPAQIEALHYFQETAMLSHGKVYTCGHSKGGNLAIYAAVSCSNSLQRKLTGVYAFDAPGFPDWFFERYEYHQIRDKINIYTPQLSIIGRALVMEKEPIIVSSDAKLAHQHSVATWVIEDKAFRRMEMYGEESDRIAAYLNELVDYIGEDDLEAFYDAMEETATRLGISDFYDLKTVDTNLLTIVIDSIQTLDPEQKERFRSLVFKVATDAAKGYFSDAKNKAKTVLKNVTGKLPFTGRKKAEGTESDNK